MAHPVSLTKVVAEYPLFQGMRNEHLELISGCARNVRFEEGQMLLKEGEPADTFYAIRHGRVAVEIFVPQRGAMTIQTLEAGDVLSWSWLLPPHHNQFDARCLSLTRALAFDAACLRGKCDEDHDLGYELIKRFAGIIAQRLRATRLQLLDLYGDDGRD